MNFKSPQKTMRHNYVVYADFESRLEHVDEGVHPAAAYRRHVPMSYAYILVTEDPRFKMTEPSLYRGEMAHYRFLDEMINQAVKIAGCYNDKETGVIMSEEDRTAFEAADKCKICGVNFSEPGVTKVRDHNHQTAAVPNYRMALCQRCNVNYSHPKNMVVFFHNLKYDIHHVTKAMNKFPHTVEIIPSTEEDYISMTVRLGQSFSIKFVDSYRFLAASLDRLAQTIPTESFVRTRALCRTEEEFDMVKRKAPFCYDYVDSAARMNETVPPPREAFFNTLTQAHISDEEYERFLRVWQSFGFATLGEYSDFYLRLDVCLLADVFEEFRSFGAKHYGLDCAHYLTLPGFALDAFLKINKAKIKLFDDMDMVLMIMSSIRGGITQLVKKHAVANNPSVPEQFDPRRAPSAMATATSGSTEPRSASSRAGTPRTSVLTRLE